MQFFSDILETPSYFLLPHWCIKPTKTVQDLGHMKKDRTDKSVYQQVSWTYDTCTVIKFLFIEMVHGIKMLWSFYMDL